MKMHLPLSHFHTQPQRTQCPLSMLLLRRSALLWLLLNICVQHIVHVTADNAESKGEYATNCKCVCAPCVCVCVCFAFPIESCGMQNVKQELIKIQFCTSTRKRQHQQQQQQKLPIKFRKLVHSGTSSVNTTATWLEVKTRQATQTHTERHSVYLLVAKFFQV